MKRLAICEVGCKGYSHESFNSAYVYALSLTYPDCDICLFAHASHIMALKERWSLTKVSVSNVTFKEIEFTSYYECSERKTKKQYDIILRDIAHFLDYEEKKCVFCLSSNPVLAFMLNERGFIFCSVVHGLLEELNDDNPNKETAVFSWGKIMGYIVHLHPFAFLRYMRSICRQKKIARLSKKKMSKSMLLNCDKARSSFIFNSEHILCNLKKVIPLQENFYCVPLFEIPPVEIPMKNHYFPVFAIFGYGATNDYIVTFAKKLNIVIKQDCDYEIRNIGMRMYKDDSDNIHFRQLNKGFLSRMDMEYLIGDVDFLLNFYTSDSYRFGCSGSVIEAINYERPVIYLKNDCYSSFNRPYKFGIECSNVDEMVKVAANIICGWDRYRNDEYQKLVKNVRRKKDDISIENSIKRLCPALSIF